MEAVFLVVHLIVAIGIIIMVLIQPAESGGFMGSGGNSMPAPRRAADTLTRITTILAGIFFVTSLSLGIIAEGKTSTKSILDVEVESTQEEKDLATELNKQLENIKKEKPVAPISK